jgi:hypothetical protein
MADIACKIPLKDLLGMKLSIPVYQRPYKWTIEHTEDLLNDIKKAMDEKPDIPYVMGSVIVYYRKYNNNNEIVDEYEIVDGQQRLTTLSILLYVLKSNNAGGLQNQEYKHVASKKNIVQNAEHISNWLFRKNIGEQNYRQWKDYLNSQLWFVLITAPKLDDAFTFFDSQNGRGKSLEDYDLLKASHLRCIPKEENHQTAIKRSQEWEVLDKQKILRYLLQNLWGRTRTLSRMDGASVDIKKEFKAIMNESSNGYPLNNYIQPPIFSNWRIDSRIQKIIYEYKESVSSIENHQLIADADHYAMLPFQLTKSIESGEPFFLFTQKYNQLYRQLFTDYSTEQRVFRKLYDLISDFNNTGIGFLVEAFEAALIFYYDKFGDNRFDEVALWLEHILFFKRLQMYSIRYSTVNNHLLAINPFFIIEQSSIPQHVIDSFIQSSESLYTQNEVNSFNFEKGVRNSYYEWMYADEGFFHAPEIMQFDRFYQAKRMIFKNKSYYGN